MRNVISAGVALVILGWGAQASAQSFSNLSLEGLPTLYVTDRAGHETTGKLVTLTESSFVVRLKDNTTRTFQPDETALVQKRGDSLKNGAIIGAVIGGFAGIGAGISDCPSVNDRSHCAGFHIAMAAVGVGIWTAIGTAIDAAIPGRTRIWPGH
jgi:hypothetical protein